MSNRAFGLFALIFLIGVGCNRPKSEKEIVAGLLEMPESLEWILVINPAGCKTCLDQFYDALSHLTTSNGAIVIVSIQTEVLIASPLLQKKSQVPFYFDDKKMLIQEDVIHFLDQILLFKNGVKEKFEIIAFQEVLDELSQ